MAAIASITPAELPREVKIVGVKQLGEGGFGLAYEIKTADGKRFVIKIIKKAGDILENGYAVQEIMLTCSYRHPNWLQGLGVIQAEKYSHELKGRGLAVVTVEYEGDLYHYQRSPNFQRNLTKVLLDIVHGYRALRALGWCHFDLKPANVLVREREPFGAVISDFGTCRPLPKATDSRQGLTIGTPGFLAPESYDREGKILDHIEYSEKMDVYAMGVMFSQLAQLPAARPLVDDKLLPLLRDAVEKMTMNNRRDRWFFQQVLDSDFYSYLARLHPERKYVDPVKVVVGGPVIPAATAEAYKRAAVAAIGGEVKKLTTHIPRIRYPALRAMLEGTTVEVISRAQALLLAISPLAPTLGTNENIAQAARVLLRIAYKLTHANEIGTSYYYEPGTDRLATLRAEETILEAAYNRLLANSPFDLVSNAIDLKNAIGFGESTIALTTQLMTSPGPVVIFSLDAGKKNVLLSGVVIR